MKKVALFVLLLTAACSSMPGMPGNISASKSEFDGSKILSMQPANAGTYGLAIGADWRSSNPDDVLLTVEWLGDYAAIRDRGGLEFNADGRTIALDSIGLPTEFRLTRGAGASHYKTSAKAFVVPRSEFDGLVHASSLKVRLNTLRGSIEGDMLRDEASGMSAINGLRRFASMLP